MITEILLLLIGLIVLVKGADFFIKAAAAIAKRLGVSELVIGLTLVALGTSIPELASSIIASVKHSSGLVIGNIVGSNIANICLIGGIAAVITKIKTNENILKRDGVIMLIISCLLIVFALDMKITWIESAIFLLLYVVYNLFLVEVESGELERYHWQQFVEYFFKLRYIVTIRSRILRNNKKSPVKKKEMRELFEAALFKDFIVLIVSGAALVFGAKYFVESSIFFARFFNVSETIIGLSVVAVGTSLPELMVSITAASKGYGDIAIGNIIGSNITNILLILGISGLIFPITITQHTLFTAIPFMILASVVLLIFIKSHWYIKRTEGIIFIIAYVLFIGWMFFF